MGRSMAKQVVAMAAGVLAVACVLGLGADHGEVAGRGSGWPEGMETLVNGEDRVHGYFVNSEDVFFFDGDTAVFNAFIKACAAMEGARVTVVLHPGKLEVRSPWDKEARDVEANWRMQTGGRVGRIEGGGVVGVFDVKVGVWLDGDIELDGMQIPADVGVESGGEIERFVEEHEKLQGLTCW